MLQPDRKPEPPNRAETQKALFDAIRKGDLKAIARSIDAGADPNAREIIPVWERPDNRARRNTEEAGTPLIVALGYDPEEIEDNTGKESIREQIVRLLIEKGGDVNRTGQYGYTPLMEAVRLRHPRSALLLLQRGAKPDRENDLGDTALTFALHEGIMEVVDALFRAGVNVNGPPRSKADTPLMNAVSIGSLKWVTLLLERGADPNLRRRGWTALELAVVRYSEDAEIVQTLRRSGAKGRSLDELKPELDRMVREVKEEVRSKEAERRQLAERYRKEREIRAEDSGVIEAVLLDLYEERSLGSYDRQGRKLTETILSNVTEDGGVGDAWVGGGQNREHDRDKTTDIRDDLWKRNPLPVSLAGMRFRDPRIRLESLPGEVASFDRWFWDTFPLARLYVVSSLPGYNRARDRALLEFSFGPTPHGAGGSSFLVRRGDGWHVIWRELSFAA